MGVPPDALIISSAFYPPSPLQDSPTAENKRGTFPTTPSLTQRPATAQPSPGVARDFHPLHKHRTSANPEEDMTPMMWPHKELKGRELVTQQGGIDA